jgi:hypothetical protein
LPPLGDIHGFGANPNTPTRVYVVIRATCIEGFDLDRFESGDLGVANRRALGYSLDWIDYVAGE